MVTKLFTKNILLAPIWKLIDQIYSNLVWTCTLGRGTIWQSQFRWRFKTGCHGNQVVYQKHFFGCQLKIYWSNLFKFSIVDLTIDNKLGMGPCSSTIASCFECFFPFYSCPIFHLIWINSPRDTVRFCLFLAFSSSIWLSAFAFASSSVTSSSLQMSRHTTGMSFAARYMIPHNAYVRDTRCKVDTICRDDESCCYWSKLDLTEVTIFLFFQNS